MVAETLLYDVGHKLVREADKPSIFRTKFIYVPQVCSVIDTQRKISFRRLSVKSVLLVLTILFAHSLDQARNVSSGKTSLTVYVHIWS